MSDLTKDTYNRIAEDWHKDHQDDDWWIEGTNTFISFLPTGAEILDVGCGGGFKSRYLAKLGMKVTGIDFSEKLIDIAQRESPEIIYRVMPMQDVSTIAKEFDGVFAQASLLHIPRNEIRSVLTVLVSKLIKGGYLYVAVKGPKEGKPLEEIKIENDYGYEYSRFFSYYTLDELVEYLKECGCELVYENITTVGNTDWIQVIGKK